MIFLDSWIWLNFFIEKKSNKSQKILENVKAGKKAIISSFTLAEIKYHIAKKRNNETSNEVLNVIESFPNLIILPVTNSVAKLAADLRLNYYSKKKTMSFGDALQLATAILKNCDILYSGDKDFKDIKEIKTVII